jgi:hypothetical protein
MTPDQRDIRQPRHRDRTERPFTPRKAARQGTQRAVADAPWEHLQVAATHDLEAIPLMHPLAVIAVVGVRTLDASPVAVRHLASGTGLLDAIAADQG